MLIEIIPNYHPMVVHFTIALYTIATLLIAGSFISKEEFKEKILNAGYINLWLGCLCTFATIAAGFHAYYTVAHDTPSHVAMTNHKNWGLTTAAIFLMLTFWSIRLYKRNQKQNIFFTACLLGATLLLAITGWKGGEVVYRYGIGVLSMPNKDSHQHDSNAMQHETAKLSNQNDLDKHENQSTTMSHTH